MNRERIMELEQKKSRVTVHTPKTGLGIPVSVSIRNSSILKYTSLKMAAWLQTQLIWNNKLSQNNFI